VLTVFAERLAAQFFRKRTKILSFVCGQIFAKPIMSQTFWDAHDFGFFILKESQG
jgi:hypothetical protein